MQTLGNTPFDTRSLTDFSPAAVGQTMQNIPFQKPGVDWNNFGDRLFGTDKRAGILPVAAGALGTLGSAYTGIKSLDLAREQFGLSKKYAAANYTQAAKAFNMQLDDRFRQHKFNAEVNKQTAPTYEDFVGKYRAKEQI